jgi:hypothetical protein
VPTVAGSERQGVCPHLGLQLDARSYFEFASPKHRCFANVPPAKIHVGYQEAYCFAAFQQCPLYGAPPMDVIIGQARRAGRPSQASRR